MPRAPGAPGGGSGGVGGRCYPLVNIQKAMENAWKITILSVCTGKSTISMAIFNNSKLWVYQRLLLGGLEDVLEFHRE